MAQLICGCESPEELPDQTCGRCGLRRLGDDITAEQFKTLVDVLAHAFAVGDSPAERYPLFRRMRGRKRPRDRRP